ncbi:MAG: lipase secretion chaperone [Acinetobacter sp.]
MQKKLTIIVSLLLITTFLLGLWYWLSPKNQSPMQPNTLSNSAFQGAGSQAANNPISQKTALIPNSTSQMDTQVNCQLSLDGSQGLIVNEQVKNCFEYFITQYGEKNIQQIKADFLSYIQSGYKDPALSQITDLWNRYLDYRENLADLQQPSAEPDTASYYQGVFDNTQNLRKKYFSDYEIEGLFGPENTYHKYTLDRMRILENKKLSETEKAKKLSALFDKLPVDWKENLQQISTLDNLRKLSHDLKARNATPEEMHQMRMNLVGAEATQRLENLDTQRDVWKNRVTDYLGERDQIQKSGMSDTAKQQAIKSLQAQQFNNPQDMARLQTFETIHDQGGKLPFND